MPSHTSTLDPKGPKGDGPEVRPPDGLFGLLGNVLDDSKHMLCELVHGLQSLLSSQLDYPQTAFIAGSKGENCGRNSKCYPQCGFFGGVFPEALRQMSALLVPKGAYAWGCGHPET